MPGSKNGDGTLAWLRDRNRQRVMEILRMHGQISQADIARATGLSRTTVSTLVSELKEAGLVADIDTKSAHAHGGRPGVQLVLRNPSHVVVGIDFGHSHVAIAVADLGHNVLAERWYDLDVNREAARALDVAADLFAEVLSEVSAERTSVLGVGMGIPGPVDRAHGTAGSATILPGWVGLRIAPELEQRLAIAVTVDAWKPLLPVQPSSSSSAESTARPSLCLGLLSSRQVAICAAVAPWQTPEGRSAWRLPASAISSTLSG